jgi:hypothetical protein
VQCRKECYIGLFAEDVAQVDQRLVTYDASDTPNNVKYTNMVAIVETIWLFVRESDSVRVLRATTPEGRVRLLVYGPGNTQAVHEFEDAITCSTQQSEMERRLVADGFALAEFTDRRVHDFLKREARKDLQKAAQLYADALGVRVRRVSIRDQSSRWGSCTSAGSLSYSWRLILAPPYVLDYLAAHEVAHLVEMNHSPRFWRVVGRICDHVERAKRWLDTYGNDLHRYGVED